VLHSFRFPLTYEGVCVAVGITQCEVQIVSVFLDMWLIYAVFPQEKILFLTQFSVAFGEVQRGCTKNAIRSDLTAKNQC
jgi:hypothetical protein